MADFSSDKLVTLSNLQTYTNALKTDIDNSTIVHKSDTAAAAGEYPVCVLDGIELKPLGIT